MHIPSNFPRGIAVMLHARQRSDQEAFIVSKLRAALPRAEIQCASVPQELFDPSSIEVLITPVNVWIDEIVTMAPNLRWIHFLSAGVDGIWQLAFDKTKYILTKSSGVHAIPMAEYVIGGILYFLKGFHVFHRQQRARVWARHWLDEATGKQIVVVGLGAIGREIAKRCKAMGMRVTGVATSVRHCEHVDNVVVAADLKCVLGQADFVVLCLPLTDQTRGLFSREMLEAIKPGAYLIDISRGGIVDQTALTDIIRTGRIAGALLDVFETEPLPPESPLWELENVLITPHVSGTTPYYMDRALDVFLQNLHSLRTSGSLTTPVDVVKEY